MPEAVIASLPWLDQLPAALGFVGLVGIVIHHGCWTLVDLFRWRDRRANVVQWIESR
ncbi:hypothetical protein [Salinisphaera sp. Q1T1-3]|uniref:hypothetical protein n=1 Tax=Salinisphaera sp. Q1T1-3 TaxID=2321229 RepID=UPI001314B6FA|nr:hypothetical protein [Salinisphaera sp. Q1T1-3]